MVSNDNGNDNEHDGDKNDKMNVKMIESNNLKIINNETVPKKARQSFVDSDVVQSP